jgi:prevent-host-death family protein
VFTITASEARANFSKLGDEIVRTGEPVTVFKNSKPWLIITPAKTPEGAGMTNKGDSKGLSTEEQALIAWSDTFVNEYQDVFEALSK